MAEIHSSIWGDAVTIEFHEQQRRTDDGARTKPVAIVVSYNARGDLERLLPALAAEDSIDSLVVDNGSDDGSITVARSILGGDHVIEAGRNLGYGPAINLALASIPPGPVLIFNADVTFAAGAPAAMLNSLAQSGAGIVVGRTVDEEGTLALSMRRDPTPLRTWGDALLGGYFAGRYSSFGEMVVDRSLYLDARDVDWATGSAMVISSACRTAVGEWNEDYFLYSEETEYMARARDIGFSVRYDPSIEIVHVGGEMRASPVLYALGIRNRVRYARRRQGRLSALVTALGLALGETIRYRRDPELHGLALKSLWRPQIAAVDAVRNPTITEAGG
jgi:N-acetylglucosaminyl-diphospho-decaprenol L-rhamnosyltransferase